MTFTFIGLLALTFAAYAFWRRHLLFYAAVFFVPFSATAVLNVGTFGLTISMFFFASYAVAQFAKLQWALPRLAKAQAGQLSAMGIFAFAILLSLVSEAYRSTLSFTSMTVTIYTFSGLIVAIIVCLYINTPERLTDTVRVVFASGIFVSGWGLLQLACSILGIPYPSFLFNNSMSDFAQNYQATFGFGLPRVSSVGVEPSFLSQSLLFILAVACFVSIGNASSQRLPGWCLVLGVSCVTISTSTTGYVGLALLLMCIVVARPSKGMLISVGAALLIIGILAVYPSLWDGILEATLYKTRSGSFLGRTLTMHSGMDVFSRSAIVGAGWGKYPNIKSMPAFVLANGGVLVALAFALWIGSMLLYLYFIYRGLDRAAIRAISMTQRRRAHTVAYIMRGLAAALSISLILQSVAGMTYATCDFWFYAGLAMSCIGIGQRLGREAPAHADHVRQGVNSGVVGGGRGSCGRASGKERLPKPGPARPDGPGWPKPS